MSQFNRTAKMLNTPDAGRFITQREWNTMLRNDMMEVIALLYFPKGVNR